jgi:hypothetical protein
MEYPQPLDGITGTDRAEDDLLSLNPPALARRRLMCGMADCLQAACLVGDPAPVVARMWERMKTPQPGDLVIEDTARIGWRGDADRQVKGFGILITHRREWWHTDAEWAAELEQERAAHEEFLRGKYSQPGDGPFNPADHERPTDHAWYIQYGPAAADICRWVNCGFTAVLTDRREWDIPVGTRDGTAVVFTRGDLLGGLADSGFALKLPSAGAGK